MMTLRHVAGSMLDIGIPTRSRATKNMIIANRYVNFHERHNLEYLERYAQPSSETIKPMPITETFLHFYGQRYLGTF